VLVKFRAVDVRTLAMKLGRRAAPGRPLHPGKLGLEPIERRGLDLEPVFVLVTPLPRLVAVLAESIGPATLVSDDYFAAHVDVTRLGHEEVTVA
jgi:hypothetical protein